MLWVLLCREKERHPVQALILLLAGGHPCRDSLARCRCLSCKPLSFGVEWGSFYDINQHTLS